MARRTMRQVLFLFVTGILLFATPARVLSQPNVVFIMADDLGWKDVGYMGADFYETPNIDRLAREGMIFTDAYTAGPNCAPTRASLISGMYGPRHDIYTPGAGSKGELDRMKLLTPLREFVKPQEDQIETFRSVKDLDSKVVSIAEILNSAGYATARFGKWHLGDDTQGFDVSSSDGTPGKERAHYGTPGVAEDLTAAGLRFIDDHREGPFFLYLSHWDVHTPLRAKHDVVMRYEAKRESFDAGSREYSPVYAAMIEAVDRSVGRIMTKIADLGLDEETLVIFTSDNGGLSRITYNNPLRAGKGSLYEGGIRVPMAARWPGTIETGVVTATPVTSVDFLPTFAEMAGQELPRRQPLDGISILPLLTDGVAPEREAIFWHFPHYLGGKGPENYIPYDGEKPYQGTGWRTTPAGAIRKGDWKLIEFFEDGRIELYNLDADISESRNLAKQNPEKRKKLQAELARWREAVGAPVPQKPNPDYTAH